MLGQHISEKGVDTNAQPIGEEAVGKCSSLLSFRWTILAGILSASQDAPVESV